MIINKQYLIYAGTFFICLLLIFIIGFILIGFKTPPKEVDTGQDYTKKSVKQFANTEANDPKKANGISDQLVRKVEEGKIKEIKDVANKSMEEYKAFLKDNK